MRFERPLTLRMSAMNMNRGTAVSANEFIEPQLISPKPLSASNPPCMSRETTAGTAIAKGTGMPAVSRPRNKTVTMKICSSGPMWPRKCAEAPQVSYERLHDREQQRGDAYGHREARNPQGRFQIGRRLFAEAVGGAFE